MIIWHGWGLVTAAIAVFGFWLSQEDNYLIGWPVAAALNFAFYLILSNYTREATYVGQDGNTFTGEATLAELSALFFIPVRYWTFIFLGLAVVLWLMSVTGLCIVDGIFFSKMVSCDRQPGPWF